KSSRHRHEDRFWFVADICWHDSLAPKLFERIIADHDNRELRRELAVCFARRAAGSYDELIKHLLPGNGRRLLELFLDLRVAWHRKNERAEIEGFVQTTRNALPKEIAEVAAVF